MNNNPQDHPRKDRRAPMELQRIGANPLQRVLADIARAAPARQRVLFEAALRRAIPNDNAAAA